MYYYAQLNMNDVVWNVTEMEYEYVSTDHIQIDSYDTSLIGKWYDRSDNTFKEAPIHLQAEISSNVISYKDQDVWLNYVIDGKAEENHTHAEYAQVSHTHDYAPADHTHSIYSLSTHTHGYLPLSGGTVSGEVNFSGGLVKVKGNQGLYATDTRLTVGSNNLETYIVGSTIYSRVAITVASDERLKEGIEDLDVKRACEFVNKLKVKEYNYIGCEDDRRIGVIAQDLIKADPELASRLVKEDKEGYLSVSYSELVGPLIVAVQQLQKRVEELEKSK